jgi:hypothetical protein
MPKKLFSLDTESGDLEDFDNPAQELVGKVPTIPSPPEIQPLFETVLWKNTIPVWKCVKCSSFRNKDQKDEFILHVLTHYSDEEEKEAVLDRLLKELN